MLNQNVRMMIKLDEILPIQNLQQYKLHLACYNGEDQPLDVFVRNEAEWHGWNSWIGKKDDFKRKFIFSLIDFYPETDKWLFGGIFEVLGKAKETYQIKLEQDFSQYIGRLILDFHRPQGWRGRAYFLENAYKDFTVSEILKEKYSGERFVGYNRINHDFAQLELIFKLERADWKASLENVKGVYLIVDKKNGKKYVGSAYGDQGVWARWSCYIGTGHGWNDELTALISREGIEYARKNFKFTLLEYHSVNTDDSEIIQRESFWKEVLLTRGVFGYNKN